jgi:biotin carboxyl carrier protein
MKLKVQVQGRVFEVEVVDLSARPIVAVVDGDRFEIWPEESEVPALPASRASAPTEPQAVAGGQAQHQVATPAASAPRPSRWISVEAGLPAASAIKIIAAPLPGTIEAIAVQAGDRVDAGQELCVLEAMKMKNVIRSSRSGEIARLHVSVGQHVKHNDALVEFVA